MQVAQCILFANDMQRFLQWPSFLCYAISWLFQKVDVVTASCNQCFMYDCFQYFEAVGWVSRKVVQHVKAVFFRMDSGAILNYFVGVLEYYHRMVE